MVWYAVFEKESGRLHSIASVDPEDEDTEVHESGQHFSLSGLKGVAHPDILAEKGLEAVKLDFNPQEEPPGQTGGRWQWDEQERRFR